MILRKRDLATALSLENLPLHDDWVATGISTDSRKIQPGNLFIALRGNTYDGHYFARQAIEKGAVGVIAEQFLEDVVPLILVPNTLEALKQLARFIRSRFSGPVIAVAGSAGKTSTKEMIGAILSHRYRVLKSFGNYNNVIGVSLTLFQLQKEHEVILLEFGTNHPGEIAELCTIAQPNVGLVTLIGPEHMEYFHTIEDVAKEELSLFRYLQDHNGTVVANVDDQFVNAFVSQTTSPQLYRYGFTGIPDLKGQILRWEKGAAVMLISREEESVTVRLQAPGFPMAQNALAAAAVACVFQIPLEEVQSALEQFLPLQIHGTGRLVLENIAGITVLNDTYNANPLSMKAALDTLINIPVTGQYFAVLGDMLELGEYTEQAHRDIIEYARRHNIHLLTVGPLFANATRRGMSTVTAVLCFEEALGWLLENVRRGDAVLFKGSRGLQMEKLYEIWKQKVIADAVLDCDVD